MESRLNLRQDINFQGLFKKLGHDLEEIRVRALDNLLSKLEHKLVCDADLVNERHLLIRLLEWFNFPNSVRHKQVICLLQRLSQHSAAAELLQDIGAIEFLSELRPNISPALQSVLDQVLENAMRLPSTKTDSHTRECIYHGNAETTELPPITWHNNDSLPSHSGSTAAAPGPVTIETPHIVSNLDACVGYFQQQQSTLTTVQQQKQQEDASHSYSESFRMTAFPWLALTPTDRHVIQSTNTSLQSREPHLLASSCEFLSDVVFQDFPAEIFLQRPNIVKNLLSILGSPSNCDTKLTMSAAWTLGDLATCLRARMRYYQDPSLCTPKQEFSSSPNSPFSASPSTESNHSVPSEPRPSAVGWNDTRHRGDGRDGDSSTSSSSSHTSSIGLGPDVTTNREETDIEDTQTLQYVQLTIPQFCALVLERALPLLKTAEENAIIHLLFLLNENFGVMSTVITQGVWEDLSQPAREMAERLAGCFDVIADLMNYHHHNYSNHDNDKGGLAQHRLAYLGICEFLAKFVNLMVPLKQAGSVLPEGLIKAIHILVFDESLSHSYHDIQISMLTVLQQVDKDKYQLYVDTARVAQSMHKACKFLMLCQEEAYKGSSDLASLAEASLLSLPYHLHLSLVTEFVKLTSSVCARTSEELDLQLRCREVLLKYLAHPLAPVRQQVYGVVLQVIKGALSVDEASEPNSRTCFLSRFLLDSSVLNEVILFGLNDKDINVARTVSDLMLHLNESQLLMAAELWLEYQDSLLRSLPILQSYSDYETKLGKSVLSITDPLRSTGEGSLPQLEKLRGTLRQMFCSDVRTRAEALKRVAWFLSTEKDSVNKLPVFSDLDVTNLTNVFMVETPRSVDEDLGRSVFQVDGLRKVYEIFTSTSVDPGVKKSAVDQLAIILQDHNLHSAFKLDGGLETIVEHLQRGLVKGDNKNEYLPYLPACVAILRFLVHHDYSLRHKLARDADIYMCLIRVAFLNQRDEGTCYEVAHLLTLLLFDEVAKFDLGSAQSPVVTFSIPHIVKKRYRLPFRPVCHDEISPHQLSLPPDPDPLQSGPPAEMLKIVWNVAWHGGMDKLLAFIKKNKSKKEKFTEFSAKLQLSCSDREILQISHLKQGLQKTVYEISNAVSHKVVSSSLRRMLTYLVAVRGHKGTEEIFSLDWFTNIGRFLKVTPASTPDESLLQEVLHFICLALRLTNSVPDNTLQWLGETLYQPSGPLIGLLHRASVKGEARDVPENVNIKRTLDKELLSFIATYNSKLPYLLCKRMKIQQLRGDLCHQLIQRLNVTDAPHFYNLASLEGTLQCLMHITARPGWSHESTDLEVDNLCTQVLNCLLEVISAFHIGRGGTSMSYMGKGVTKAATLCLRHLAHEMATSSENKNWAKQWSYLQQKANTTVDSGLNWMLALWAYRDPEVRAAGLGIAVALTSTEPGRIVMTSHCKHIPGGIWGAAFSILLDQAECSMVRQQAALLLVNLTSQTMPCGSVELEQNVWQGPIVTDTEFEVSLVGLTALLALLHHSNFYQEMLILLSNFFAQPTVQPVSVIEAPQGHLSSTSSDSTVSTIADYTNDGQQSSSLIGQQGNLIRERLIQQGQLQSTSSSNKTRHSTSASEPRNDTSTSTVTGEQYEYHSIATPSLVSAMCQLLRNLAILAPQDTFTCLKRDSFIPVLMSMVDTGLLEAYMVEMEEQSSSDQLELVFCDLLMMYSSILHLLRACAVYDTPIRQEILSNDVFMRTTASLLTIRFEGSADVDHHCQELWESVFTFHTSLLQLQGGSALHSLTCAVQGLWPSLSDTVQTVLEKRLYYSKDLYDSCLVFLSVLFSEEGKLQGRQPQLAEDSATITSLLNSLHKQDSEDKDGITSGSQICKVLVSVYDHTCLKSPDHKSTDKVHAVTALRTLLAVSSSAKNTALELGLVESVIEHIKSTNTKLNLETLQPGKPTARKKDDPVLSDLTLTFDLLRNFIFQNLEAKMACFYSGLHNAIHKLWAWCQLDVNLMTSSLALLATYVAHCPTATSSLAYSNTSSQSVGGKSSQQLSNNSMVHCLIRLTGREGLKDTQLKTIFSILATLTLSSECRNILFKSNFLQEFSDLNPRKTKKSKRKQNLEIFWLELLVNLSFSVEGQQMILKTGDAIELLLDFVECCQGKTQECAVLILRNLCCHTSNKPKLLSNEKLLPRLLDCLGNDNEKVLVTAASAMWALVFNNQKAKVVMKNANLVPKLQETIHNFNNQSKTESTEKCVEDLQCVITAVME